MNNLLRFLKLYHSFLLFIIIECLSISLLIYNNEFQNYKFLIWSKNYTEKFNSIISETFHYLNLKETNDYLAKENAKLQSLISKQKKDFQKQYDFQTARIINNSVYKRNNYITLNKGRKYGMKEGLGVIVKNGIVGVIQSVSENYSLVISVLHKESNISVILKNQNIPGILRWEGFNYKYANIYDIPYHIELSKGDTISSSGFSSIFPKNIDIGLIESFQKNKINGYYNIRIKFFIDFYKLNYVYIVHSPDNQEQLKL
ncbi:MAG: rod shape-determining protein MreC, partial [Bacteroidota bacterium]|nr:rod shape-determining protein MreC [Bacteroidota bacterium]